MKDTLYIGSQSKHRQQLLEWSEIKYKVLKHKSDECGVDLKDGLMQYAIGIARSKMEHVIFPQKHEVETEKLFVLTVDTIVVAAESKEIFGKAKDLDDARRMLKILQKEPADVITGCCLEKRMWKDDSLQVVDKIHWATNALVEFCVEDEMIEAYLKKVPGILHVAGAVMIEHPFGQQFCKQVQGSYSTIIGLPLFELRENLKRLGFCF
jgi:septum formation protein